MHEQEHGHAHSHPHAHEPGQESGDTHSHAHGHEHTHASMTGGVAPEERARALLAYMIEHNEHHASELTGLMDSLPNGAARERLRDAIGGFEAANARLREVLDLIKGE